MCAPKRCTVLSENLMRGVIKDRVLRNGEAVHIIDVHVSRDLETARCFWEPSDRNEDVSKEEVARFVMLIASSPCISPLAIDDYA